MPYNYKTFNGVKFREEKPGGYYIHISPPHNIRMHRYVWEYYNGPIPEGYHIHHIDGIKGNNDISNLTLMLGSEHSKLHGMNLTPEQREFRHNNIIENALPKACEWHKSEAGREWHAIHIKEQYENRVFDKELTCSYCGKTYIGRIAKKGGNTFCSNNCKAKFLRHKRAQDSSVAINCIICGKEFFKSKWSNTQTCSRSCRNKLRWRNIKANESKISEENE